MGLEWSAINEMILERNKGKSVINEESENNEVGVQEQEEGVEEKDEDNPVENERGEDEIEEESDEEDDNFEDAKNSFIPDLIFDEKSGKRYVKGEILGRGGFGECHEIQDSQTRKKYACKVIPGAQSEKNRQSTKSEIDIHMSLRHKHIVGLYKYFIYGDNLFMVMELCKKESMGELLIRRETLTEYETRYFMKQILDGVNYMHKQKIVHRDLKLQNIFLDKGLNVKIGDFGLSARIKSDGKKRRTCCGTLCFMAPEILSRTGHSYEADVWSLGCIMYMFIKGVIPFTPSELEPLEFAANIDGFEIWYELDGALQDELRKDDSPGMSMISRILRVRPLDRPTVEELINDPFLTSGYLPKKLPESCLTEAPTFDQLQAFNEEQRPAVAELDPNNNQYGLAESLKILKEQLKSLFEFKTRIMECSDQKTEANYHPRIWVTKTTDQSAIYGFGYKLSNGSVGVLYNDATRLTMLGDHRNIVYTDQLGQESHHTISNHTNHLIKKIVWLKSISNDFMDEKLDRKADAGCNCAGPHVHLHQWISTEAALMMLLTDGTLQINFAGQTILILSPIMASVTHVDQKKIVKTYCLKNLQKNGCSATIAKCLRYVYHRLDWLSSKKFPRVSRAAWRLRC